MPRASRLVPEAFDRALADYRAQIQEARRRRLHHDQLRAILLEFLRKGFQIPVDEIELERGLRGARIRGFIDALYRSLVIEVKRDLESERSQGTEEITRYLQSTGGDGSFGLLTDGADCEVYLLGRDGLRLVHRFSPLTSSAETVYRSFDAYLFSGKAIVPTAEEVILRFGDSSPVFAASFDRLQSHFEKVREQPAVVVKYDEWQRLLAKVYGSAVGDYDLFLRHTYLAAFARLLAFLALERSIPSADQTADILTGEAFTRLGLTNLAEDDFFSWLIVQEIRTESIALLQGIV